MKAQQKARQVIKCLKLKIEEISFLNKPRRKVQMQNKKLITAHKTLHVLCSALGETRLCMRLVLFRNSQPVAESWRVRGGERDDLEGAEEDGETERQSESSVFTQQLTLSVGHQQNTPSWDFISNLDAAGVVYLNVCV